MKKRLIFILLLLLVLGSLKAQKPYFNYRLLPDANKWSQTPHIVADFPYYYLMGVEDDGQGTRKVLIYKADTLGNIIWKKLYGDTLKIYYAEYDVPGGCVGLDGNIYYRLTTTDSLGYYKATLLSIRPNGQQRFLKIFGNGDTAYFSKTNSIIASSDSCLLIHGTIWPPLLQTTNSQHFLMKVDTLGNELWVQQYGGIKNESANGLCETPDKGFILGAMTLSFGNNKPYYKPYIVKTDSAGNFQWQKTYGSIIWENDGRSVVTVTQDDNILVGYDHWMSDSYHTNIPEVHKPRLIKLDLDGNTLWDKYVDSWIDEYCTLKKIIETPQGDLLLILGGGFARILKTTATGELLWNTYINRIYDYHNWGIHESGDFIRTPGGSLIVAGYMNSFSPLPKKYGSYVMKLDSMGCNLNSPPVLTGVQRIKIQPGTDYVNLSWQDTSGNPNRGYHVVRVNYYPITDYPGEYEKREYITTYKNNGPIQQFSYTDTLKTWNGDTLRNIVEYYVYAVDLTDSTATCASNSIITYPVGLTEVNKSEWQVNVFPNPFTTQLNLTWLLPDGEQSAHIQLIELATGRILSMYSIKQMQGSMQIETGHLANGIYLMKFVSEKQATLIKKIVKTQ